MGKETGLVNPEMLSRHLTKRTLTRTICERKILLDIERVVGGGLRVDQKRSFRGEQHAYKQA